MPGAPKIFGISVLILVMGILQNTDLLLIAGVKPNLLLVLMIALAFFVEDAWLYGFYILECVALLASGGLFAPEIVTFVLLLLAAAWVSARWHTQAILTAGLVFAASTVFFYIFSEPTYLLSSPGLIGIELVYNVVVGLLLFKICENFLNTNSMLRT